MSEITQKLDEIALTEKRLGVERDIFIRKALEGDNPDDIIKASGLLASVGARDETNSKSYVIDPMDFISGMGYKDRTISISYDTLRRMSKVPIINAVIKTRVNQVASFAEPQKNKYSTGFKIVKKSVGINGDVKMTRAEIARANKITDFMLSCGQDSNAWLHDDLDTFIRKFTKDSMVYDQGVFEVVRDRKGVPNHFIACDGATFRLASTINDNEYQDSHPEQFRNKKSINGYYPSYVQIDDGRVAAEFYPWELCFGLRNPDTNVFNYGYGNSELEDLIQVITASLWADEYNRRFFQQGGMPKGLLRVDSSISPAKLQEFKQYWLSMMMGVSNAHKLPIIESGKVDFVNMQQSNTDMEFGKWQEYLIKIITAIWAIDPAEVNFPLQGGSEQKSLFESNNDAKLKHSKDKGLYPILKFVQSKFNKYLVGQIDPEYELRFVGMDAISETEELDMALKKVGNIFTLNEVRQEYGLKKVTGGDNVLNGVYSSLKAQEAQAAQGTGDAPEVPEEGAPEEDSQNEDYNPFEDEPENEGEVDEDSGGIGDKSPDK